MTQWGLDTLFNPAKRHMDEEKRRLQSTREEVGDNSGGRRIDLESGKVVIRRADEDDELGEQTEQTDPAADAGNADVRAAKAEPVADQPAKATSAKAKPVKDRSAQDKSAKNATA